MSEPFIGEIRIFAGNFSPRGWALCDGQSLPIAQNTALFSILGVTYGGDGRTTFDLPDLRGRGAMHEGTGPGLSSRRLGQMGGQSEVTLSAAQMPEHSHQIRASSATANIGIPTDAAPGDTSVAGVNRYGPATDLEVMDLESIGVSGGEAHNNLQPFLAVTFIIALIGVYPTRS